MKGKKMSNFNFKQTKERFSVGSQVQTSYSFRENKEIRFISNEKKEQTYERKKSDDNKLEFKYIGDIGFSKNV